MFLHLNITAIKGSTYKLYHFWNHQTKDLHDLGENTIEIKIKMFDLIKMHFLKKLYYDVQVVIIFIIIEILQRQCPENFLKIVTSTPVL